MSSWLPVPYRVLILGGGLSGLSAAHTVLKYAKAPCQVTIIECQDRVGGWLESSRFDDGVVFEHGPRSARSYGSTAIQALDILSDLDIESKIIGVPKSADAAKRRYIYANGKLCELPSSITSILTRQEPFSKSLLSTLAKEPFVPKSNLEDESIYDFFSRRFSKEVADYLSDPMCRGIFGGDARKLSIRSCFKILHDYERYHGSIIRGALFSKSEKPQVQDNPLIRRAKAEKWMAWSMKNGIQTLPEIWVDHLKAKGLNVVRNTRCEELVVTEENKVQCITNNGTFEAERIISSLPSCALAPIVKKTDSKLSDMLNTIKYASMAVINLEYASDRIPYQGFGFLVPSIEPCDILGTTFDSLIFPELSKKKSTVITSMAGGDWFQELFGHPDLAETDKITELAVKSAHDILGMKESPTRTLCKIQKDCIPQYEVGHESKVDIINNHVRQSDIPLTMIGTSWGGVGVNDVIVNAREQTLRWLASHTLY